MLWLELRPPTQLSQFSRMWIVIDQLTEFRLDNGMKFIVLERHQAPVVSCSPTLMGGAEPEGKTGGSLLEYV